MASASKEMEPMKPNTHGTISEQFSCIRKNVKQYALIKPLPFVHAPHIFLEKGDFSEDQQSSSPSNQKHLVVYPQRASLYRRHCFIWTRAYDHTNDDTHV